MKSLILFLSLCILSTHADTLRIATPDYSKDGNSLKTPYLELIDSVYRSEGIDIVYFFVPWARARVMVDEGEADAMLFVFHSDSEDNLIYPTFPMGEETVVAVYKKGKQIHWQGEKSLLNKRVVYVRGYDYSDFIATPFTVVEVSSNIQGWKMVESSRVDFFLDDSKEVEICIEKKMVDSSLFRIEQVLANPYYITFNKSEKNTLFLEIWDKRVPLLLKEGVVKSIFDRYSEVTPSFAPRENVSK